MLDFYLFFTLAVWSGPAENPEQQPWMPIADQLPQRRCLVVKSGARCFAFMQVIPSVYRDKEKVCPNANAYIIYLYACVKGGF